MNWWDWLAVRGFGGWGADNDPPFPIWPKVRAWLREKLGAD
jgi:hypothetical protein